MRKNVIYAALFWMLPFSVLASELKILVFGDSLVAGYGLSEDKAFCAQLEDQLSKIGIEAEVINGGISGDTTQSGLSRADQTLSFEHDVVILELGANDMLRAIDPKVTKSNLEQILDKIEAPVYLLGMRAMPNYGLQYQSSFDAIYPDLAKELDLGFYPFIFSKIMEQPTNTLWRYFQSDMLHANAKGIQLITTDLAENLKNWLVENELADIKDEAVPE